MPTIIPFPTRYSAFALCVAGLAASLVAVLVSPHLWAAWVLSGDSGGLPRIAGATQPEAGP